MKLERWRDLLVPVLENPGQAGEVHHWTAVKLHGYLKEELGLEVGYSTTVRYLHELGYNLRVPRPWPERQNEEQRNAGALGAAGLKCLISETISGLMSLERCVRPLENAAR